MLLFSTKAIIFVKSRLVMTNAMLLFVDDISAIKFWVSWVFIGCFESELIHK